MKEFNKLQGFEKLKFEYSWWAAKRAVSSSRVEGATSPKNKDELIQKFQHIDFKNYDKWHSEACTLFSDDPNLYGISAKFIAIFMKTYYVINDYNKYKNIVYPPIDSRTLKNLKMTKIKWSKMSKSEHITLMSLLRNKYVFLYEIEELWDDSNR